MSPCHLAQLHHDLFAPSQLLCEQVVGREALTPQTLAGAIRAVLEAPSYAERARYHGERLRAESPPARVRELVTAFVAERSRSSAR